MTDPTPPGDQPQPPVSPPPGAPAYPAASAPVPPPPPGAPAYAGTVAAAPSNGIGVASLVLAILGIIGCIPFIGSILGIVLGRIGINKAKRGEATNGGVAKAGFWVGIAGLILAVLGAIVLVILIIAGVAFVSDSIDKANNSKTGLADGQYGMEPNASLRINDRCSFSGQPVDLATQAEVGGSVTLAGEGVAECGTGSGTPDVVLFTVSGGVARIVSVQ